MTLGELNICVLPRHLGMRDRDFEVPVSTENRSLISHDHKDVATLELNNRGHPSVLLVERLTVVRAFVEFPSLVGRFNLFCAALLKPGDLAVPLPVRGEEHRHYQAVSNLKASKQFGGLTRLCDL